MSDFDVSIIGAGPAGSLSALLLSRMGLRVALFDRARFPRDKVCGDGITPRGARLLMQLGIVGDIHAQAFAARGVTLRGSDENSFSIAFGRDDAGISDLLILPRLKLDYLLLEHALAAGPRYFEATKVVKVDCDKDGPCRVLLADDRAVTSTVAIIATGAESQLLRKSGLLAQKPAVEHAARVYFDDVKGLDDHVTLFFDGVDMPGYGWIFPTSASSANIGCGVFAQRHRPQAERLRTLIDSHPLLRRQLEGARQTAPIKAYPLRTDFRVEHAGRARILCVGEAAGLVNPITGEGIDYAFESAQFAAEAISSSLARDGGDSALAHYRERLRRRFATRFAIYRWVQAKCLSGDRADDFLAAVKASPALRQTVVDGLFGRARPRDYLRPNVLLPALKLAFLGARRKRLG